MWLDVCWTIALACLTFPTYASASNGSLVVQATRLIGFEGCTKEQSKVITQSWDNAIELSTFIKGKIKWNEIAEFQFLGPPAFNKDSQGDIQSTHSSRLDIMRKAADLIDAEVIENAATFGRPYFWNPFGWQVNVRCDDYLRLVSYSPRNFRSQD